MHIVRTFFEKKVELYASLTIFVQPILTFLSACQASICSINLKLSASRISLEHEILGILLFGK